MQPYRLYFHERVWEALSGFEESDRHEVVALCRRLAADPFCDTDYVEPEESLPWQCILRNGWAVIFYPDHAAKELKIGHIRRADG